jgi:asparagine synthase (glutamine-hydrolysing)
MEADALFAGMPRHKLLWLMNKVPIFKRPLGEIYNLTQSGIGPRSLFGGILSAVYFRDSIPPVPKVLGVDYVPSPLDFPAVGREFLNRCLIGNFQNGACQDTQKVERTFAAWGIEFRSPFLDRNLVEVAYSISDRLKIKNGTQKYILRRALSSIVPKALIDVPKLPQRMKYDLEFSTLIDELSDSLLSKESIRSRGFFDVSDIRRLRRRKPGRAYSGESAMRLWTALLTEVWARVFLDHRGERPNK